MSKTEAKIENGGTGVGASGPGIGEFIRQTRQEISKVTWPTRSETTKMTIMIVVMALIAGVFFLGIDTALSFIVRYVLGMNS